MKQEFYIKNMVCDRCKMVVKQIAEAGNAVAKDIQLGKVVLHIPDNFDKNEFQTELEKNGFELIQNPEIQIAEAIKTELISLVENHHSAENLSSHLSKSLHKDYTILSKTFKKIEAQTIEKFFIKLKIEKVKELIQMNKLSFSEIAYQLDYNSINHLSNQFKTVTGITMSAYKNNQDWNRTSLDKIV